MLMTPATPREVNRQILLNLVREQEPISRADLARRMQIARGMVTSLVDELIADGSLYEGATKFGETFTFAELEAVIEFMRWQEKNEKCSYNAASYGWRRLMGDYGSSDEFQTFQERLGMAREAVKRYFETGN